MKYSLYTNADEDLRALNEFKKRVLKDKQLAKDLLIKIGAMTRKGRFTRRYAKVLWGISGQASF
jgi:hypothetical protein